MTMALTCYRSFWLIAWALGCLAANEPVGADEPTGTCQDGSTCHGAPRVAAFHHASCARPRLIYRTEFPSELTGTQCAGVCKQTISCRYFRVEGRVCETFSSCKIESAKDASSAADLYQIPEDPARCSWSSRCQTALFPLVTLHSAQLVCFALVCIGDGGEGVVSFDFCKTQQDMAPCSVHA